MIKTEALVSYRPPDAIANGLRLIFSAASARTRSCEERILRKRTYDRFREICHGGSSPLVCLSSHVFRTSSGERERSTPDRFAARLLERASTRLGFLARPRFPVFLPLLYDLPIVAPPAWSNKNTARRCLSR